MSECILPILYHQQCASITMNKENIFSVTTSVAISHKKKPVLLNTLSGPPKNSNEPANNDVYNFFFFIFCVETHKTNFLYFSWPKCGDEKKLRK